MIKRGIKYCVPGFAENGKKPKVAIVACMRKMLTMLNAMMRDNAEWRGAAKSA